MIINMSKFTSSAWTLEEAIDTIRLLQPLAHQAGFSLALGGSVLNDGKSYKDLDIVALHFHGQDISDKLRLITLFDIAFKSCGRDGSEEYDGQEADARATQVDELIIFHYDVPDGQRRIDLFIVDRKRD